MSEYAFAADETHLVFRLRTAKGDLERVTFFFADRADMSPELPFSSAPMPRIRSDLLYDWYEYTLETDWPRIAYYFLLSDGKETCRYAGGQFEKPDAVIERAEYFQYPFNHRADLQVIPSWAKEAVVYNIFPDSFADGKRSIADRAVRAEWQGSPCESKHGGTLNGIQENLDYIKSLGCNCIYLNPVFAAGAYHKYDLLDYEHIDPCFGTDADFDRLVEEAHQKGLRVIVDGVFNHISSRHPFFRDVLEKGKGSVYYPYFYSLQERPVLPKDGEAPGYMCFSYVANMPKTDTSFSGMREYFCRIGAEWIANRRVDGWRLDVANELDDGFLRAFRSAVKKADADALIVGEVWEDASHYMNGDMLDSAMNYDFRRFCTQFFAEGVLSAEEFDLRVSSLLTRYRTQAVFAQLNLLDGHDVSRFLSLCGGDTDRFETAVVFQMTFPGMPCVFFGDEKGMQGVTEEEYRQKMAWESASPLEDFYRRLIRLRKAHPALTEGTFETVKAEGGLYIYRRSCPGESILAAINTGSESEKIPSAGSILLQKGLSGGMLEAKGYCIIRE